ncbi:MAG: response regulator [Candidatus Heimdallarchaeota archaeon]|nr:response regulator [Candidatus Heimdallarchaeota archaeon]
MARILLVDDERDLLLIYTKLLMMEGHEVVDSASNGKEAIEKFGQLPIKPDIIILDYRMPVLDGLVAMREILKKDPNAKVLFVSAEKRVEKEALESGAIGFFTKPTSIRTLLAEIDRIQQLQTEKLRTERAQPNV